MAEKTNFIIGQGETLRTNAEINQGGGDKVHPYSFDEAAQRLQSEISEMLEVIDELPTEACPHDEAVIAITLHPSYLAKSYNPIGLLKGLGLRQVGSREARVSPFRSTRKVPQTLTSELFIAGSRKNLKSLDPSLGYLQQRDAFMDDFRKIESVRALGRERLKGERLEGKQIPLEVVLHIAGGAKASDMILGGFEEWCERVGRIEIGEERDVGSLAFLNVRADEESLEDLLKFSFLRLVRRMPKLAFRSLGTRVMQTNTSFEIDVVHQLPVADHVRVAVFDGGLPDDHPFGALATPMTPLNIGSEWDEGLEHGTQVTSAVLFGPIEDGKPLEQPYAKIDHWRVVDDEIDDFELTMALDRITNVLNSEEYDIANLSLGPDDALDDDDVHVWTATLDQIAAQNRTLIVSAAGNNGEDDELAGLNRVQPSSDGVNILAVGARDKLGTGWVRAPYSAKGPGRSPGLIKPDCVAMGGTDLNPFFAISDHGMASGTCGTSFSSPTVVRLAAGLKASYNHMSPTAIRALLLHTAKEDDNLQEDVGWGSVCHDLNDIIMCADDEATVIYQGTLGLQRQMRYPIPCPPGGFSRRVSLLATFVIASPIDPEDAVSYTQVGAQISFRPETVSNPGRTRKGKLKAHPTKPFFGQSGMYQTEQELRGDAHRWECVKRAKKSFNAGTLDLPVFDIEHLVRENGGPGVRAPSIPYALIVTISEPGNTGLYESIIQAHSTLRVMVPGIEVPIRT